MRRANGPMGALWSDLAFRASFPCRAARKISLARPAGTWPLVRVQIARWRTYSLAASCSLSLCTHVHLSPNRRSDPTRLIIRTYVHHTCVYTVSMFPKLTRNILYAFIHVIKYSSAGWFPCAQFFYMVVLCCSYTIGVHHPCTSLEAKAKGFAADEGAREHVSALSWFHMIAMHGWRVDWFLQS